MSLATAAALTWMSPTAAAEPAPKVYFNGKEAEAERTPAIAVGEVALRSTVLGSVKCIDTFYGEAWNQREHLEASKPVRGYGEVLGLGAAQCRAPELLQALEVAYEQRIQNGEIRSPLTITATAEMPLELVRAPAELCRERTKTPAECAPSERETESVITAVHRRPTSLPWKAELINNEAVEGPALEQRVGLHEFGESGTAAGQSTKCYPREGGHPATFKALPAGCIGVNIVIPQIPAEFVYYGTQEVAVMNGVHSGLFPSRLNLAGGGPLDSSEELQGEATLSGMLKVLGSSQLELMQAK